MQAIQSATSVSASLLRMENRIGAIKPGFYADMVAVNGDPLADISLLRDVRFVVQGGRIVKSSTSVPTPSTLDKGEQR